MVLPSGLSPAFLILRTKS